ncbi:hypothetical protein PVAG01_04717 [Phlyctema vagabunda]|uniref:Uncharacterized protein n=1 Tax=Phlyctema vagabunda TaxID=108571 RepID=A0ABR4PI07_9HELO
MAFAFKKFPGELGENWRFISGTEPSQQSIRDLKNKKREEQIERMADSWLQATQCILVACFYLGICAGLRRREPGVKTFGDWLTLKLSNYFLRRCPRPPLFSDVFAKEQMSWKAAHLAGMSVADELLRGNGGHVAFRIVQVTYETSDNKHLVMSEAKTWLADSGDGEGNRVLDPRPGIVNPLNTSKNITGDAGVHEIPSFAKLQVATQEYLQHSCARLGGCGESPDAGRVIQKNIIIQQPDYHGPRECSIPDLSAMQNQYRSLLVEEVSQRSQGEESMHPSIAYLQLDRHGILRPYDRKSQIKGLLSNHVREIADWTEIDLTTYLTLVQGYVYHYSRHIDRVLAGKKDSRGRGRLDPSQSVLPDYPSAQLRRLRKRQSAGLELPDQ